MQLNAPKLTHIDEVLPSVKDNPAFAIVNKGWYTVIDYRYMTDKLFNDPVERECRGLKFCATTGKLLARPYHKFHNLNERPAFATDKVDLTQPHIILDKVDGSMVHTCPSSLGIYLMTRMGDTDVAKMADKFMQTKPVGFSNLFNALSVDEYTHIFEYVGPNNQIVVPYAEEKLILTAIRNNYNGTYVFHEELVKLGKAFGIPVVDAFPFDGFDKNISKIATCVAGQSNNEGIVVRFDTGQMIKIKADEYVRKHRSKDLISSQKGIINLILEDKLDDVLPQLDEAVRDKATDYQHQVNFICAEIASDIQSFVEDREAYEQKAFALDVQKHLPKRWQSATYNVRKGDDPLTAVKNTLLSNCKTSKDATAFLDAVDIPLWSFSFFSEE